MAPPINRRPGFSRRAQYSTFFGYIAGVLGMVCGAILLLISLFSPDFFAGARSAAASAAEPAGSVTSRTRGAGRNVFEEVGAYFAAASKNARLTRELKEAKVRLAEADSVAAENRRLKKLLGISRSDPPAVAAARLTSSTATSSRRFATFAAGSDRGVLKGMPVRSQLGLIGRILEVGPGSSRVLLVTDTESLVPVRRTKDGISAFAQGRGDGTVQIRLIDLSVDPIKLGDVFVTSGSGGLYRPGTAVSVITRTIRDDGIGKVLADPADTEYAVAEPIWAPEHLLPVSEEGEQQARP